MESPAKRTKVIEDTVLNNADGELAIFNKLPDDILGIIINENYLSLYTRQLRRKLPYNGFAESPALVCKRWERLFWINLKYMRVSGAFFESNQHRSHRFASQVKLDSFTFRDLRLLKPSTRRSWTYAFLSQAQTLTLESTWLQLSTLLKAAPQLRHLSVRAHTIELSSLPRYVESLSLWPLDTLGTPFIETLATFKSLKHLDIEFDGVDRDSTDKSILMSILPQYTHFPLNLIANSNSGTYVLPIVEELATKMPLLASFEIPKLLTIGETEFYTLSQRAQDIIIRSTCEGYFTYAHVLLMHWSTDSLSKILPIVPFGILRDAFREAIEDWKKFRKFENVELVANYLLSHGVPPLEVYLEAFGRECYLEIAICAFRVDIMKAAMSHGAKLDEFGAHGIPALHIVLSHVSHPWEELKLAAISSIIDFLIASGVNISDHRYIVAAFRYGVPALEAFVAAGVDFAKRNESGELVNSYPQGYSFVSGETLAWAANAGCLVLPGSNKKATTSNPFECVFTLRQATQLKALGLNPTVKLLNGDTYWHRLHKIQAIYFRQLQKGLVHDLLDTRAKHGAMLDWTNYDGLSLAYVAIRHHFTLLLETLSDANPPFTKCELAAMLHAAPSLLAVEQCKLLEVAINSLRQTSR